VQLLLKSVGSDSVEVIADGGVIAAFHYLWPSLHMHQPLLAAAVCSGSSRYQLHTGRPACGRCGRGRACVEHRTRGWRPQAGDVRRLLEGRGR
jgi:hypothetical protein